MSIEEQRETPTLATQLQSTNMPKTHVITGDDHEDEVSGKESQRDIDAQFQMDIDPIKTMNAICKAHPQFDKRKDFLVPHDDRPFVAHPIRKKVINIPVKYCSAICPREEGEDHPMYNWKTSVRLAAATVAEDVASLAPEHQEVIAAFTTANTLEVTSDLEVELSKEDSAHRGAPTICQKSKPWTPAEVVVRMIPSLFDSGIHALKLPETDKYQLILNGVNEDGETTYKVSMLSNMIAKYVFHVDMIDAVKLDTAEKKAIWISNVRDMLFAVSNDRAAPVVEAGQVHATPTRSDPDAMSNLVKEFNRRSAETTKGTQIPDFQFKTGIFYTCTIDSIVNACDSIGNDYGWRNLQQAPQVLIRAWKQVTTILVGDSYVPQMIVNAIDNPKDMGCTPDSLVDRAVLEYVSKFTSVSEASKSGAQGSYKAKKLAEIFDSWLKKPFLSPSVDVLNADAETTERHLFNATAAEKAFMSLIETRMSKADAKEFTPASFAAVVKQFKPVFEALLFKAARVEPKTKKSTAIVHAAGSRKRKAAAVPNEMSAEHIDAKITTAIAGSVDSKFDIIMEELRALKEAVKKQKYDAESDDEVMLATQSS